MSKHRYHSREQYRSHERKELREAFKPLEVIGAVGMSALAGVALIATLNRGPNTVEHTYEVEGGDTAWDIAKTVQPESDPRAVIEQIEEDNSVDASLLLPNQELIVQATDANEDGIADYTQTDKKGSKSG